MGDLERHKQLKKIPRKGGQRKEMTLLLTLEGWAGLEDDTSLVTIDFSLCLSARAPSGESPCGRYKSYLLGSAVRVLLS
jgi:hypothetical protein